MPAGSLRDVLEAQLRARGFHRLHLTETLDELLALVEAEPRRHPPRLAIVDLVVAHAGDAEPLEAVRSIESGVLGIGTMPTVILCEAVDPTLLLSQAEHTRFLGHELTEDALRTMDALLDLDAH
jgi:allophanate hydrolase subunit 1